LWEVITSINYEELVGISVARFGISSKDFYDLTPVEFRYALECANNREEREFHTQYEVARYMGVHIWNSAGKSVKKGTVLGVKDIDVFSWEQETEQVQRIESMKMQLINIANSFKGKGLKKTERKIERKQ